MNLIVLDSTAKSIRGVLAAAVAANQPEFTVHYMDVTASAATEGNSNGVFNSDTNVEVLAAPGASTRRVVRELTIYNKDTSPITFTLMIRVTATDYILAKITLGAYERWDISNTSVGNYTLKVTSAAGDIIYRNATVDTRLPIGTAGKVLRVNVGATAPEWWTIPASDLTTSGIIEVATAGETTAGNDADRAVSPDGLAGSNYGKRVVEIAMNGATALALTDKAYFRVPSAINGWNLVEVQAMAKTCTTHFHVTLKNGATAMLSTDISIEDGEYDTSTSLTPPVIDTAHDEVATGNQLELATITAGAAVTYLVIELTFQAPQDYI